MKKFLLAFALLTAVHIHAQNVLLNEVFTNETSTTPEFIELVNTGVSPTGENLNCYSVVTYYYDQSTNTSGFYVLDLPDTILSSQKYFVLSSQSSFMMNDSTVNVGFNWNTSSASSGLKNYIRNGNGYTVQSATSNNILIRSNGRNHGNNGVYAVFLFYNGQVVDVFLGGNHNLSLPTYIASMPDLPAGSLPCSSASVNISSLDDNAAIVGNVNPPVMNEAGYIRTNNNRCGTWQRANGNELTPGYPNASSPALVVSTSFVCGSSVFTYSFIQSSGAFNVTAGLYYDVNNNGALDAGDVLVSSNVVTALNTPITTPVSPNTSLILVVQDNSANACGNSIVYFNCVQGGPLPVLMKNFNAVKRTGRVSLTWETTAEANNRGFEILRKTTRGYEQIGFVASQSADGNSASGYRYSFDDADHLSGTVYYRLRQVDRDGIGRFSDIKALRFTGNVSVSIFPNPAVNGKTNVVLPDDAGVMQIALYDFTGRVVQKWDNNHQTNLSIGNLKRGAYTLKITLSESGEVITERIIVN